MEEKKANDIFKEFKEHSIAEFFKKNKQMLGYAGLVRSLVTVVHEYITNSIDACEEADILPDISVKLIQAGDNRYRVIVSDNGPGIPKKFVGRAMATILAGTKFHRYIQQRGQQGIGASGCTLFSQVTTGKPIHVESRTANGESYSCNVSIDTLHNKPIVTDLNGTDRTTNGLTVDAEFAEVKYENSDHGVYEYIRRTALANPHVQILFTDPEGKEYRFVRAVDSMPTRPKPTKPHPLGLSINDLLEFAHKSDSRKVSSFLMENFARVSQGKVEELRDIVEDMLDKDPGRLEWGDAEQLLNAIKKLKWMAPDPSVISAIGEEHIKLALKNILNPDFMHVVERKAALFYGGIPFVVEAAIAYGGAAGKKIEEDIYEGNVLRFANRVPLLFDSGSCAITVAAKSTQWKRYGIDMESQPVSVFVNVSSVYIPYSGVGKEAIAQEDEIIDEIKLALMEAARGVQRYIRGKQQLGLETSKYRTIERYAKQLAKDVSTLTGTDGSEVEKKLETLISKHYPRASEGHSEEDDGDAEGSTGAAVSTATKEE